MTTLNARANQAWQEWLAGDGEGLEAQGAFAFEEGWEAGYRAACAEQDNRLDMAETRAYDAGWNDAKEDGKL